MERLDYGEAVEKDAKEFVSEHIDEIAELMVNMEEDLFTDDNIEESLDEFLDRPYAPEDAIFVLDNCENEESDSGLWEGIKDWRRELEIRAAYTYINDVRRAVESIYKDAYDEFMTDQVDDSDDESDDDKESERAKSILNSLTDEKIEQVEPGTEREKEILSEWLRLNRNVGMRGGYPLGGSYIDGRCGVGFGMPEQYIYVKTDRVVGKQLPHLAGKYRDDVEKYFLTTFGEEESPC
jgi:hypothetical protein